MSVWSRIMKVLEGLAVKRGGACPYAPLARFHARAKPAHPPYR
ncbi:hypothetical protein [Celeribacter arenosi]